MEKHKILRQYIFSVAVLLCLTVFLCGTVAVKEKTEYNMYMTPYDVIAIDKKNKGAEIRLGERAFFIQKESLLNLSKDIFFGMIDEIFVNIGDFFEKST